MHIDVEIDWSGAMKFLLLELANRHYKKKSIINAVRLKAILNIFQKTFCNYMICDDDENHFSPSPSPLIIMSVSVVVQQFLF